MAGVLVTGGTGLVGRFVVEGLTAAGHDVTVAVRSRPKPGFFTRPAAWRELSLEPDAIPDDLLDGIDAVVHAAFDHVPGKYRGGEGDDPEAFRRRNVDGSLALFERARAAGVPRAVFLSSRAVYGEQAPGALLFETMQVRPDTFYGQTKRAVESGLEAMAGPSFLPVVLRATGVYGPAGPGRAHKWQQLFEDYGAGREIGPRIGTEVHGDDLAKAVRLAIEAPAAAILEAARGGPAVFNVSDILLDRRDLLAELRERTGSQNPLPPPADAAGYNVMDTSRLRDLGWMPRGVLDLAGML